MILYIKNMINQRCTMIVKIELERLAIPYLSVTIGEILTTKPLQPETISKLNAALQAVGLEIIEDRKTLLIERIIIAIKTLVYQSDDMPHYKLSDYISQKLSYDYTYLSNQFSKAQGISIEQCFITHRIERAKSLLLYNQLQLTQIAYLLQFSSVSHLSNQFKKLTGQSPTNFKKSAQQNNLNPIQ